MLATLTSDDFKQRVGESFTATFGGASVALTLTSVSEVDARYSRPGSRLGFSLIFHGPVEPPLPQGSYTMHIEGFGEFALFTVPLGPADNHQRYQVIFS